MSDSFWDEPKDGAQKIKNKLSIWFNGPIEEDRCSCGGRQHEEIEYSHSQASRITVLECEECGKKVHGGKLLGHPVER